MAEIRCSACGKNNPDFLDSCQFCQSPLIPESKLFIGEEPTKKDTGELEEILPDWLKDVRQQGKNAEAGDDSFRVQTQPRVPKDEPPDLLAGLLSQSETDEEEIPDWLAGIAASSEKPSLSKPSSDEGPPAFFAGLDQPEKQTVAPTPSESKPDEIPDWMRAEEKTSKQHDDLSARLSQPSSAEPVEETDWAKTFASFDSFAEEPAVQKEPEDLSWLRELEASSKEMSETPMPQARGSEFTPAASNEDLSWLNELGGISAPAFEEPAPPSSSSAEEDLSWLTNLGGATAPASEPQAPSQSSSSNAELDWLSDLQEATNLPSAPAFADTGELNSGLGIPPSSKPFQTAPLNELLGDESIKDVTPDWLKNALEESSMPAPGSVSMDWFSEREKPGETKAEDLFASSQGEAVSSQPAFDFSLGDSSAAVQDLDALFNVEMPDWLAGGQEGGAPPSQQEAKDSAPAFAENALSPVELPSWVQAMRPVDSALEETAASVTDQITETQGPLAGFRGIIPAFPIGSSLRPKALSLKLQVTGEQQTGASLLEQIIASETTVQPQKEQAAVSSQRVLRWVLSGLFLMVLGAVIGLGSKTMPIYASATHSELSSLIATIPENAPVLVVVDYEPSFAGELEATAGPLLDQLALSRRAAFSFISMSPTGSALADRLILNTGVGGLGYQPNLNYFHLGFLPGGSSGVLAFIENPENDFTRFEGVILITDHAESGRVWVEQLQAAGPEIAAKPLLLVASAQAGPLLQPYVSAGQADVMIHGLYDAAKYEFVNNSRPGTARAYWDAFGSGILLAVFAILSGGVWGVLMRMREQRRAELEQE
ncbi:MAG: hypothetical protein HXY42_12490 [Chloroflexi bacterium]|nr:hypothetical protein [Chloroflexota bacterium]